MAYIATLKKNNTVIYPQTKSAAVYEDDGETPIEDVMVKKSTAVADANKMIKADGTKALVGASNIDFTTLDKIYNNEITTVGKTYTISVPGVYLAWGTSSTPSNGSIPTVTITMGGVIRAKSVNVSDGSWTCATAVAVGLLNSGDKIIISQENANSADNRSSVGMCLIQRTQ